jgi:hypothetical protein
MNGIRPESLDPDHSDRSVAADVLVREEPDEEGKEEGDDEGTTMTTKMTKKGNGATPV